MRGMDGMRPALYWVWEKLVRRKWGSVILLLLLSFVCENFNNKK